MSRLPRPRSLFVAIAILLALTMAGCSGGDDDGANPPPTPYNPFAESVAPFETELVSSLESIVTGPQRLVFLARNGPIRIGGPDQSATVEIKGLGVPAAVLDATWVWGDEKEETGGAWVVEHNFESRGTWRAVVTVDGEVGSEITFQVEPNRPMPRVGESPPATDSETLATAPIETLTTDDDPDARFYQTSISDAIGSGQPTALIFSTPAYCTTDVCGPLLDMLKDRADGYPNMNFVHLEVYEDVNANDGDLIPRQAIPDWGIATEPWVFFVGSDGLVKSVFEGIMSSAELDRELAELS